MQRMNLDLTEAMRGAEALVQGASGDLSHRARYPPGTGDPIGTGFNGIAK